MFLWSSVDVVGFLFYCLKCFILSHKKMKLNSESLFK